MAGAGEVLVRRRWRGVLKAEFTNMAAMLQRAMAKRS